MKKSRIWPVLLLLSGVVAGTVVSGCGGGSHGGQDAVALASSTLIGTPASIPPLVEVGRSTPAGLMLQQADCPSQVKKISVSDSTLKNLVLTLGLAGQQQLIIRTGETGLSNLETCLVRPMDFGYTPPPEPARLLMEQTGATVATHLIAKGDLSMPREVRLMLPRTFESATSAGEIDTYRIVAYTQNTLGVWQRTVLDSRHASIPDQVLQAGGELVFDAVVTQPGYYAVEREQ